MPNLPSRQEERKEEIAKKKPDQREIREYVEEGNHFWWLSSPRRRECWPSFTFTHRARRTVIKKIVPVRNIPPGVCGRWEVRR
jgi:hypothetical protein